MRIPVTVEAFWELVVYVLIMGLIVTLLALHDVLVVLRMALVTCQVMMSSLGCGKETGLRIVTCCTHYRRDIVTV